MPKPEQKTKENKEEWLIIPDEHDIETFKRRITKLELENKILKRGTIPRLMYEKSVLLLDKTQE